MRQSFATKYRNHIERLRKEPELILSICVDQALVFLTNLQSLDKELFDKCNTILFNHYNTECHETSN